MADSALANDKLIGHSFDDYRIIDVVGRGGMGTVYRAWDEVLRRDVALKVMLAEADRRARERFLREAQFAAKLDHENIVRVYRGGSDEGYLYLAMEFIGGQSLRALLGHNGGGVPVPQALSIAHQLLSALSAAHENNIVHRDIKPENILLRQEGGVKILDFGVAKVQNEAFLTRADEILGTVEYMAPEQILGEELGPAVDLYAVGAVLYELLVGRLPFSGDSPATLSVSSAQRRSSAPVVSQSRCTDLSRPTRPATAGEIARRPLRLRRRGAFGLARCSATTGDGGDF